MTPPRRIGENPTYETQTQSVHTTDKYSVLADIKENLIALDKDFFGPKFQKLQPLIGRNDLSMAEIRERREIIEEIELWMEREINSILAQNKGVIGRTIDKIPLIGKDTDTETKVEEEPTGGWLNLLGIAKSGGWSDTPSEWWNKKPEIVKKQVDFNHKKQVYTDYLKLKNTELQSPYIESIIALLDSMWVGSYKDIDFSRHEWTAKFIEEVEGLIEDLVNDKNIQKQDIQKVISVLGKDYEGGINHLESEVQSIIKQARTAEQWMITANGLEDSFLDFNLRFDKELEQIDENIQSNLMREPTENEVEKLNFPENELLIHDANKLKKIWLDLKISFREKTQAPEKDQLKEYANILNWESKEALLAYYGTENIQDAITKLINDLNRLMWENMQARAKEVKNILKTEELSFELAWESMEFTNLQERNFALTSLLYTIKWFAEDIQDPGFLYVSYILGSKAVSWLAAISWFWIGWILWDTEKFVKVTLLASLIWATTYYRFNAKIPMVGNNKLKDAYNNAKPEDKSKILEAEENKYIKDRHNLLSTIREWIKIERDATTDADEKTRLTNILDNINNVEKRYMFLPKKGGWDNVFYARLFKSIYWYDGGTEILRLWMRGFLVPGWAGLSEDMLWKPHLRWWSEPRRFSPRKLLTGINGNHKGFALAFDILGDRRDSNLNLNEDVTTFKSYLEKLETHFRWTVGVNVLKWINIVDIDNLKAHLKAEIDAIDDNDTLKIKDVTTRFWNIAEALKDITSKRKSLPMFQDAIDTRLKTLISEISHPNGGSDMFLKKLQTELVKEIDLIDWVDWNEGILKKLWKLSNENTRNNIIDATNKGLSIEDPFNNSIQNIAKEMDSIINIDWKISAMSSDIQAKYNRVLDIAFHWDKADWAIIDRLKKHFAKIEDIEKKGDTIKKGKVIESEANKIQKARNDFFKGFDFTAPDSTKSTGTSQKSTSTSHDTANKKSDIEVLDHDSPEKKRRDRFNLIDRAELELELKYGENQIPDDMTQKILEIKRKLNQVKDIDGITMKNLRSLLQSELKITEIRSGEELARIYLEKQGWAWGELDKIIKDIKARTAPTYTEDSKFNKVKRALWKAVRTWG